ncbi:sorting nexin-29 isoform X2 [Macrosteles quadrilineatus]|uniref:sorting nexin-29 isoform X2 n=1 Tax=Macrosteles quadrilineatus TaxID=74068 RepID=UPI0023E2F077|nr:sorting nexin-29 isoform X2 [Macrosteles quadrilineatus]
MLAAQAITSQTDARKNLQTELLHSVKLCQTRFGGRTELATELDPHVVDVCNKLEAVLSHGLRTKALPKKNHSAIKQVTELVLGNNGQEPPVFWHFVRDFLTKHERDRYEQLKQIYTDTGRGRAWLRSALNEKSLERYMLCLTDALPDHISEYYEDWAFLRDQDLSNVLPPAAAGLASILFAINICRPELNHNGSGGNALEPVIPAPTTIPGDKMKNRRRRVPGNIISFDEDDISGSIGRSSPPTQSTSPTEVVVIGVECVEPLADENGGASDIDISGECDMTTDDENKGLRPISNSNVGELIPVPLTEETQTSEDSLSVPSFSEDADSVSVEAVEACSDSTEVALDSKVARLQKDLEAMREATQGLKAQLRLQAKQHQQDRQSLESRNMALDRENELLKHQLRKYVGAVQMLKQQEGHNEEADLYEKKLVQVAEMHAELMELNDRIQRRLQNKEATIRRLRTELESLRGPLLESDDEDLCSPALVSLWIPSVFLASNEGSSHHVYQIHLRICDEEWNVYRRYAQFYLLHKTLKKQYPVIGTFFFPPKKTLGNKDAKFVEERRQKLQQYLRRVMNHLISSHSLLTTAPSKPLLISLMPFFGDQPPDVKQKSSPFSRNSAPDSPQYAGL